MNTIPVDYSGYVSSVQELENNIIIDSGMAMTWGEYDNSGTLIKNLLLLEESLFIVFLNMIIMTIGFNNHYLFPQNNTNN